MEQGKSPTQSIVQYGYPDGPYSTGPSYEKWIKSRGVCVNMKFEIFGVEIPTKSKPPRRQRKALKKQKRSNNRSKFTLLSFLLCFHHLQVSSFSLLFISRFCFCLQYAKQGFYSAPDVYLNALTILQVQKMAGKGGKGLLAAKTPAANKDKDKDKKKPISRSSRAGIQVFF